MGSIPSQVIPKTEKMVPMVAPLAWHSGSDSGGLDHPMILECGTAAALSGDDGSNAKDKFRIPSGCDNHFNNE